MNKEIRDKIRIAGLKQWQVAKACGVTESTFIRWLRDELSEDRKNAILKVIGDLSKVVC